jgi:hypothetical protein
MIVAARKPKKKPPKGQRGPKPDRLVLEGNWEEAVRKALVKGKPSVPKKMKGQDK